MEIHSHIHSHAFISIFRILYTADTKPTYTTKTNALDGSLPRRRVHNSTAFAMLATWRFLSFFDLKILDNCQQYDILN